MVRNRLEEPLDAALNLLDRQVVDDDGLMVCKVDDLALREIGEDLVVDSLLVGPAALLPRFSGGTGRALLRTWLRLGVQHSGRAVPSVIAFSDIERIDSDVQLSVPRKGLLRPAPHDEDLHRLADLLGCEVRDETGARLGQVVDVRLEPRDGRLVCDRLVVGQLHPGSLLGYDRRQMGPVVLARFMHFLHRHTGQVSLDRARDVDWEAGVVTCTSDLEPLM